MIKRSKRIFQIAKEFNISHTEILNFLKEKDVDVSSHMSPKMLIVTEKSRFAGKSIIPVLLNSKKYQKN